MNSMLVTYVKCLLYHATRRVISYLTSYNNVTTGPVKSSTSHSCAIFKP